MEPFFYSATVIFGLLVGSFLNVCIFRIPRGESIVTPPSHCPRCFATLSPIDLVPILAWIFYGRRCKYCGKKISIRYPLIETLNAILFVLVMRAYILDISPNSVASFPSALLVAAFLAALVVVTMIDIDFQIIPNSITYPFMVLGLAIHGIVPRVLPGAFLGFIGVKLDIMTSVAGLALAGGLLWLISVLSGGGMGMGDAKLAAAIGAVFGPKIAIISLFISFFLGAVIGLLLILTGLKRRKDYIPFGPYIAIATAIVLLAGPEPLAGFYWSLVPRPWM